MSFFKDFKEDLTQAMNEIVAGEEQVEHDIDDDQMVNTLDDEIQIQAGIGPVSTSIVPEAAADDTIAEIMQLQEILDEPIPEAVSELSVEGGEHPVITHQNLPVLQEESKTEKEEEAFLLNDEITVIKKGTTITGTIMSDGSLEILGAIHGDIDCLGKLTIIGEVIGNSMASEVDIKTKRLEGSINSEGSVNVNVGTVVIGDITASSAVIAGAVKGQIDINGPLIVESTAIVKGNINAKSVQVNTGAVIDGFCSLANSEVDIDSIIAK